MYWELPLSILLWIINGFAFIGLMFLVLWVIAQFKGE